MSQAIIVAGQSNALGYNVTAAELPASYHTDPKVVIWNDTTMQWDVMRPGINTGTPANPGAWGPEVAYAMRWTTAHPNEVLYVVKDVKGETALAQTDGLDWSPQSHGELFDATAKQVADSHIGNATVLWVQGEQDGYDQGQALAYGDNLAGLKTAAAQFWGAVRFITAQSQGPGEFNDLVQQGEGPDAVDTSGVDKQADGIHYNGVGQIELGDLMYDAWASPDGY